MDQQKRRIKQRIDLLEDEEKLEQLEVALDMIEAGRGSSAAMHPDALALIAEVLEAIKARDRAKEGQRLIDSLRELEGERQRPRTQPFPWQSPQPPVIGAPNVPQIGAPVAPSETVHIRPDDPHITWGVNTNRSSDKAFVQDA